MEISAFSRQLPTRSTAQSARAACTMSKVAIGTYASWYCASDTDDSDCEPEIRKPEDTAGPADTREARLDALFQDATEPTTDDADLVTGTNPLGFMSVDNQAIAHKGLASLFDEMRMHLTGASFIVGKLTADQIKDMMRTLDLDLGARAFRSTFLHFVILCIVTVHATGKFPDLPEITPESFSGPGAGQPKTDDPLSSITEETDTHA